MARHWIFATNPENLVICLNHCVFGVDPGKYGYTAQSLVNAGDLLFFYVRTIGARTRTKAPSTCQKVFLGPYIVRQPGYPAPNHPAVQQWTPSNRFTIIIEIEKPDQPVGAIDINSVLNDLLFITNKAGGGRGGWQDHVQFSIISIREDDYNLLLSKTNTNHQCITQLRNLVNSNSPCKP